MKALAGLLLAFSLAVGIRNQADARQCANKKASKQMSKSSAMKHNGLTSHSTRKCVCRVGASKTKVVTHTGVMKTKSYGGYKRVNKIKTNLDNNSSDFDSTKIVPLDGGDLNKAL